MDIDVDDECVCDVIGVVVVRGVRSAIFDPMLIDKDAYFGNSRYLCGVPDILQNSSPFELNV